MQKTVKIPIPCDGRQWHPSPLPGQVVLVTTCSRDGQPNVAPKSWISMVAFGPPPVLMFGCRHEHTTAKNALLQGQFVVNVPGSDLLDRCWAAGADHAGDRSGRFARHGFTPIPAIRVRPPRIEECHAHLECEVDGSREWGRELVIFGRIVAVSVDAEIIVGRAPDRYRALSPFFFADSHWALTAGALRRIDGQTEDGRPRGNGTATSGRPRT